MFTFDKSILHSFVLSTSGPDFCETRLIVHYVSQQIYKVLNLYSETKNIV